MNIAQLSEQLKDVPQGTLINYARDPNSVVPQFLALAEIQRRQHLQTAGQGQPPSRTVAEDVLNQANPSMVPQPQMAQPQQAQMATLPENQPGVTSLPTGMAQGMAGGGIVAFADGGEAEDDEDIEMAKLFPQKSGINFEEMLASIPSGIRGLMNKLPQSYEAEKAKASNVSGVASLRGSHPYETIALDEARRLGIDPKLIQHILYKETGNLKDPATARSHAGAYGPMQLMPGTAKELGVDINDPEQNTRGGVRYFAKMLDQFKDPTHAMAAYNAGPGRVSNMIRSGRGIESLKPETQNYVRMAKGGIAHFYDGDLVTQEEVEEAKKPYIGYRTGMSKVGEKPEPSKFSLDGLSSFLFPEYAIEKPAAPTPMSQYIAQDIQEGKGRAVAPAAIPTAIPALSLAGRQNPETYGLSGNFLKTPQSTEAIPTPKSKADEYFEALAKDIQERAAQAKEEGDINKYLAIMQAGFAMMGGSSPYAMTNIGKGAEQGISTYGALRKQSLDTQKDISASRLGLAKYQAAKESSEETREQNKLYRDILAGQRGSEFERKKAEDIIKHQEFTQKQVGIARDDLNQYTKDFENRLLKRYPQVGMGIKDPKYDAELQQFYNTPEYLALKKMAYPNLSTSIPSSGGVKQYNPKTGKVE